MIAQPGNYDDRSQTATTPGSAYVFVRASHSSRWRQEAVLAAPAGNVVGNGFGQAVAVSANGSQIAVGAPGASVGGDTSVGAVYVFTRPPAGWSAGSPVASLTPSDPADGKGIGGAVAISGSVVVAGNGRGQPVYLFIRQAGQWASETQTAELSVPPPPAGCSGTVLNSFGGAVAVDGGTVAVGDDTYPSTGTCNVSGAVFIFEQPAGGWANTSAPTATLEAKHGGKQTFGGESVALQGGTLVAGAPDTTIRGVPNVGVAYVFERPAGGWRSATETARLFPAVPFGGDLFGSTVAISGNAIIASNSVCPNGPAACPFVYRKPARGWRTGTRSRELVPPVSAQRGGGVRPLAAGRNTAVQVSEISGLPAVVFRLSRAGKS